MYIKHITTVVYYFENYIWNYGRWLVEFYILLNFTNHVVALFLKVKSLHQISISFYQSCFNFISKATKKSKLFIQNIYIWLILLKTYYHWLILIGPYIYKWLRTSNIYYFSLLSTSLIYTKYYFVIPIGPYIYIWLIFLKLIILLSSLFMSYFDPAQIGTDEIS